MVSSRDAEHEARKKEPIMNKNTFILSVFSATLMACTVEETGSASQADAVVLDVRCAADAECPAGFECETEIEQGVDQSYCVSHEGHGTSDGACPAGYELETEHEGTFCKPHGGDDSDDNGGTDDIVGDDSGGTNGGAAEGAACQSSAECAAGLECEVEVEHGVTTSICKAHGGAV
jgi:Cys-rich repeat protein